MGPGVATGNVFAKYTVISGANERLVILSSSCIYVNAYYIMYLVIVFLELCVPMFNNRLNYY